MIRCTLALFITLLAAPASAQSDDLAARKREADQAMRMGRFDEAAAILERAVTVQPSDAETRWLLADAYTAARRPLDAVGPLVKLTELQPTLTGGWYALGRTYNAVKQQAIDASGDRPDAAAWRQLRAADTLLARGQLTTAFVLYRATLTQLPAMSAIHDSVAKIYEASGHPEWAAQERAKGALPLLACASRAPLCEFRAGRYDASLAAALAGSDAESMYWRARAAGELATAAFNHLDALPDSIERRIVRATVAHADERFVDAVTELKAALTLRPGDPDLLYDYASSCFEAGDYEQASTVLVPLMQAHPDDARTMKLAGYALLELQRPEEALPLLQHVAARGPSDARLGLALGRAYLQAGDFTAAVPMLEAQLDTDQDGSLHVQLARAYKGLGQAERAAALLTQSQDLLRSAAERRVAAGQQAITPPNDQ